MNKEAELSTDVSLYLYLGHTQVLLGTLLQRLILIQLGASRLGGSSIATRTPNPSTYMMK